MIELIDKLTYLVGGKPVFALPEGITEAEARRNTIAYGILSAHNVSGSTDRLRLKFDAMLSHDITYVGIIQTARMSGIERFPLPYALTNCHNSLCAVGGTINEDDHAFGLSAAKRYGGIYVPANLSVIHSYAREMMAAPGSMIMGSDSHTRYGALGTMGIGEGGPELVKQLLNNTYDINYPKTVLVYLTGSPKKGVGPHDVAVELVRATFKSGFVNNKVLEFTGPGLSSLSAEYRNGIDVMTTETTCLSSIWETDGQIEEYLTVHGRKEAYRRLCPGRAACYDGMIKIELDKIEPMIALPFHPSNAYTIKEFLKNAGDILSAVDAEANKSGSVKLNLLSKLKNGRVYAEQGIIAGCAGGLFNNIAEAAAILDGSGIGNGAFGLSVYPTSAPVNLELARTGVSARLISSGAVIKPSFCGPCFGAGDVPQNNGFSVRHTTRNFPNREGSIPKDGQISAVALMDSRSIAATAKNGGAITPATDMEYSSDQPEYRFDPAPYNSRVYNGYGNPDPQEQLILGPNITDWPQIYPMQENLLLRPAAVIRDAVTTTDELIPSGETSSYRSNPQRLAEFTLSRRVPEYVGRAKAAREAERMRQNGEVPPEIRGALMAFGDPEKLAGNTSYGSCVFANRPGDGSAREQAASCQRVLGTNANLCYEYATKRYRSNCINWGIVPFTIRSDTAFEADENSFIFVPDARKKIADGESEFPAKILSAGKITEITLYVENLTDTEREILLLGCLMNYYAVKNR